MVRATRTVPLQQSGEPWSCLSVDLVGIVHEPAGGAATSRQLAAGACRACAALDQPLRSRSRSLRAPRRGPGTGGDPRRTEQRTSNSPRAAELLRRHVEVELLPGDVQHDRSSRTSASGPPMAESWPHAQECVLKAVTPSRRYRHHVLDTLVEQLGRDGSMSYSGMAGPLAAVAQDQHGRRSQAGPGRRCWAPMSVTSKIGSVAVVRQQLWHAGAALMMRRGQGRTTAIRRAASNGWPASTASGWRAPSTARCVPGDGQGVARSSDVDREDGLIRGVEELLDEALLEGDVAMRAARAADARGSPAGLLRRRPAGQGQQVKRQRRRAAEGHRA